MRKRTIIFSAAILSLATLVSMNSNKKEDLPLGIVPIPAFYTPVIPDSFYEKGLIKIELKKLASYKVNDFNQDSREVILARMLLGEVENCSQLEKIAVAYTAINRVKASENKRLKDIILQPRQYSCFNEDKDSNKFLKDPIKYNKKEFLGDIELAEDILSGKYNDPTEGATHYYNPDLVKTPQWAKEFQNMGKIGHHLFFK
jgi:N-acetylmuramoyl-L-alanine amidase